MLLCWMKKCQIFFPKDFRSVHKGIFSSSDGFLSFSKSIIILKSKKKPTKQKMSYES